MGFYTNYTNEHEFLTTDPRWRGTDEHGFFTGESGGNGELQIKISDSKKRSFNRG
jgi:hypothetical protein